EHWLAIAAGIKAGPDSVPTSSALQQSVTSSELTSSELTSSELTSSELTSSELTSSELVSENDIDTIIEAQLADEMPTTNVKYDVSYDVSYEQFRRANTIAGEDLGRVKDVVQKLSESFSKNPASGIKRD
ncbi:MAG: hypothetical protein ACI9HK_003573, partial [Pirellulaceae bacterium]